MHRLTTDESSFLSRVVTVCLSVCVGAVRTPKGPERLDTFHFRCKYDKMYLGIIIKILHSPMRLETRIFKRRLCSYILVLCRQV